MSAPLDQVVAVCKDRRAMKVDVAGPYADLLAAVRAGRATEADVAAANRAIIARWSSAGLLHVKRMALRRRRA